MIELLISYYSFYYSPAYIMFSVTVTWFICFGLLLYSIIEKAWKLALWSTVGMIVFPVIGWYLI